MKPPVRMVCGDCLRSVELVPDAAGRLPAECPVCGGTIDSRLSEMETPTSNYPLPVPGDVGPGGANAWTETWAKGSLGMIGRFQLREILGDGGFGVVYQAYDPRLDRDVALKILKQTDPGERVMQRFFREARIAARLSHPNIVAVHDAGCDGGRCWIAYEFIKGRTLARQAERRPLDTVTAVRMTRDLADALDHAHHAGVYHRDVKPANVLLDGSGRPHLIDFGLARRADIDSDLTRDGAILGTPGYIPPEQANGRSHLADERSDVYSLGVMLYELVCGRRPVELPSGLPTWQFKPTEPVPPPRSLNPSVPPALERVILKALARDPRDRYVNARVLALELDRWLKAWSGAGGISHSLSAILLGIAGSILLVIAINLILPPLSRDGVETSSSTRPPPGSVAAAPSPPPSADPPPGAPPAPAAAHPVAGPVASPRPEGPRVAAVGPPDQPAPPGGEARVTYRGKVVHVKGHTVFHHPNCQLLLESLPENQDLFDNESLAESKGLKPCRSCWKVLDQLEGQEPGRP